jgi:hypothetical protein
MAVKVNCHRAIQEAELEPNTAVAGGAFAMAFCTMVVQVVKTITDSRDKRAELDRQTAEMQSKNALAIRTAEIAADTAVLTRTVKTQGEQLVSQAQKLAACEQAHAVSLAREDASAEQRSLIRSDVEALKKTVAVVAATNGSALSPPLNDGHIIASPRSPQ